MKPDLCQACHENGYQCERPAGHEAVEHRGGDFTWAGTTRWRETQNLVLRALMHLPMSTREAATATGLHIRTVQRHVLLLDHEGRAWHEGRRWCA